MTSPTERTPLPYEPKLIEAIDVWWSYTWRTLCLLLIASIPLAVILILLLTQMDQGTLEEGQVANVNDKIIALLEKTWYLIALTIFALNSIIGFVALREVIKITYRNFTFAREHISSRDLWTISLLINSFTLICSFLAPANTITSELSHFLYFLIEFMVTCGILWHSMTNGIFGARLPTISTNS